MLGGQGVFFKKWGQSCKDYQSEIWIVEFQCGITFSNVCSFWKKIESYRHVVHMPTSWTLFLNRCNANQPLITVTYFFKTINNNSMHDNSNINEKSTF